ncbi:MAG: N-acetylmuramoyl-L-alanine amidase [Nisaea sp.]|uniref:N-acetylmuramoyl-L-alanine amidase n=1 Tax=Nisaea sp. TaxID=2024842 RepID=UPI001B1E32D8|nr:N-acetylmuramoyl-L-alanine amidase [Nisaea sp.]MBO6560347.1 N-acetylmuramoyl-L-alanine amidase [Nisaea sp.]
MIQRLFILLTLLLGAIAAPQHAMAVDGAVRDIRIGQHPDKIRFVMDLSQDLDFTVFSLADPYRVVIDLPEVKFEPGAGPDKTRPAEIKGFRFGLFRPGTSRLVIDTAKPFSVASAFKLPAKEGYGPRIVIDLKPTTRAAFLEESQKSVAAFQAKRQPRLTAPESAAPPLLTRPPRLVNEKIIVAIDAGHGGVDPGAIGVSGIYEKEIVLNAARVLKSELERTGRYEVVLTRDRDVFLQLRERIAIARREGADLFLSLHADSIPNRNLRGASVYTLSETASDKEADLLAQNENKSDIIAGMDFGTETPEVTSILIDLAQRETMNHSARFAGMLVREMRGEVKLLKTAHRFAGFAVLKAPDIPSVLIELGFLSNNHDEKLLRSNAHLTRVAAALRRAIDDYFDLVQSAARAN